MLLYTDLDHRRITVNVYLSSIRHSHTSHCDSADGDAAVFICHKLLYANYGLVIFYCDYIIDFAKDKARCGCGLYPTLPHPPEVYQHLLKIR